MMVYLDKRSTSVNEKPRVGWVLLPKQSGYSPIVEHYSARRIMSVEFTLEDAEKLYKSCGCSGLHMYRDEPVLYQRYVGLNISRDQEFTWMRESF